LLGTLNVYGQKKFPAFSYITIKGDTITDQALLNKSSIIVMGHITCPGMLFLLKDFQKAALDTFQVILFLENTKEQALSFNSDDTSNIWAGQRSFFKISHINFPVVTFCGKEKIKKKRNGTVSIKIQCNKLKFKYRALNTPTIYAVNNEGKIIKRSVGWYLNTPDPQRAILQLFQE
jgi:hypothetical protein